MTPEVRRRRRREREAAPIPGCPVRSPLSARPEDVDDPQTACLIIDDESQHSLPVIAEERLSDRRLAWTLCNRIPGFFQEIEETLQ
jgi:hypothetical protein